MQHNRIRARLTIIKGIKRRIPLLILEPDKKPAQPTAVVMWIHGGGYITGMKEMAFFTLAHRLVRHFGVTVVSPGYRMALLHPYPTALTDCHAALMWVKAHCKELNARPDQIILGGESAGGGLTAALCLLARDMGTVNIAFQMPVYPMLSASDTESSRDNHGRVWNTRKNHIAWRIYLRGKTPGKYASPSLETDHSGLPPCYTFVGDREPFYRETLDYVEKLRSAGIKAECDVYHSNVHALDIYERDKMVKSTAIQNFEDRFEYALRHYFAPQGETEAAPEGPGGSTKGE